MQGLSRARGTSGRGIALGASLLVGLASARVRAAETAPSAASDVPVAPELALTWQAPAGCPTASDVERQFARLLGGASRLPSGKHIDASALVRTAAPDRWSVELATVMEGAVGRRTLAGDSCASLASAASLILALMIDPAAAERALLAAPTRAPEPLAPKRAPEAIVSTTPSPPEPRALRGFVRLYGGGVFAMLPTPAPAGGLALGAGYKRLAVELSFLATEEQRVGDAPAPSGDLRLLVGGARACGTLGGRIVIWQVCLGGELERLAGTGVATPVRSARTKSALMGAGTGGLLVTVPLGARLGLSLDLDAAVRPYHPHFSDGETRILQIPVASGFAALGLVLTI